MITRLTVFRTGELLYCQDRVVCCEQKVSGEEFWIVDITKFVKPFDTLSGCPERL
jgi:hypothetical protein